MQFRWPLLFSLLLLVPVLAAAYWWVLKKRRRVTVRYSSLALIKDTLPRRSRLKQHLPFGLLLVSVTSLIVALTGPISTLAVPVQRTAIILAIDVSLSMCTTDIQPNRLEAAKEAALDFIDRQDPNVQIGVVGFAGFAILIQEPTTDREALRKAVTNLAPARRTAIGSAIVESLDAIAEVDDRVPPIVSDFMPDNGMIRPPEGDYLPHIVALLTDGVTTSGIPPLLAAEFAVNRGIRVYPIGFGTTSNSFPFGGPGCEDMELLFGGSLPPGAGAGGTGLPLAIDEVTLGTVAEMTGGEYFAARSALELQDVFQNLPTFLVTELQETDFSVVLIAIGLLFAAGAMILGFRWRTLP